MENLKKIAHVVNLPKSKSRIVDLYRHKLNEHETMVLEKENNPYLSEHNCYCTHLESYNGKVWGHYNMNIVDALRDLANRIEKHRN